jgi:hypothetical protein
LFRRVPRSVREQGTQVRGQWLKWPLRGFLIFGYPRKSKAAEAPASESASRRPNERTEADGHGRKARSCTNDTAYCAA